MKKSTDFTRDVIPVFGVPFDVIDMAEAERCVADAALQGRKYFVSTPNLNFLALCQRDESFRHSVLMSDLSVADGMSVTLLARWLGTPLPERIAGSTLFEKLSTRLAKQLRVYLFGGPDGVAEQAAMRMNNTASAAAAVGWQSPGFCSVEEMSSTARLAEITKTSPNFVLVALGAHKGQAWITRNLEALPNAVVSHLGAVINFQAGHIQRAPRIVQSLRLEWMWRIKEEPALWHRYRDDALLVGRILLQRLANHWVERWQPKPQPRQAATALIETQADRYQLHLDGDWGDTSLPAFAQLLTSVTDKAAPVAVIMATNCTFSARALGKLLLLAGHQLAIGQPLQLETQRSALRNALANAGLRPWLLSLNTPLAVEQMQPDAAPTIY